MQILAWIRVGSLAGLSALCASGAVRAGVREQEGASAPRVFRVAPSEDGLIGLPQVLAAFQGASGTTLAIDEETQRLVDATRFYASGTIECDAADAMRVCGSILSGLGYFWSFVRGDPPRVLAIRSLGTVARATARQDALFVPVERLAEFESNPGLLVQTIVSLPSTDVRTVSNALRSLVVDPNTLQIIPAGNSSQLVIQGFAPGVVDLVTMLVAVDRSNSGGAPAELEPRPAKVHGASGEFRIAASGDEQPDLQELVRAYARATGQVLLASEETLRLLGQQRCSLSASLSFSGDDFPTFCEELLRERRFALSDLSHGGPCLVVVESLETSTRATLRSRARYVDAASLPACARRPATLFTTMVELPHTDVRTLSNSMRAIIVDPNQVQIVPVGTSSGLLLQGPGRELVHLVEMLRRIDGAAAEEAARAPREVEKGEEK